MRDWPAILGILILVALGVAFLAGVVSVATGSSFTLNMIRILAIYVVALIIWFGRDRMNHGIDHS